MTDLAAWLRVRLRAASEPEADLAADALVGAGAAAVRRDGLRLTTHLPVGATPGEALRVVRDALERAGIATPPGALDWAVEADRDWTEEWKAGLRARRIGERFVVHPTWIVPDAGPDDLRIAIDPGMAFGTAEHATTRGALRLLEAAGARGASVLDAGTGSGILAIAALRLGAATVLAVDVDADAVAAARANLRLNGVDGRATVLVADVTPAWLGGRPEAPLDLILANILSGVLEPLLPSLRDALAPRGSLIVSGILAEEASVFRRAAGSAGLLIEREDVEEEWWSARFSRPRPAG